MVPQEHGGAIYQGGVPGNKGGTGRPSAWIKGQATDVVARLVEIVREELERGADCPKCGANIDHCPNCGKRIDRPMSRSERFQALRELAKVANLERDEQRAPFVIQVLAHPSHIKGQGGDE